MESERAVAACDDLATMPTQLPEVDRGRWNAMTAGQRRRASDRLKAIEGWNSGTLEIESALKLTELSRSRFYRMAAEWRAAPSLTALGAFAGTGGTKSRLDPDAVNALQAVVAEVVSINAGASVSQLVSLMVQRAGVPADTLPGTSRLRAIVETEQRRVAATGEAGHALKLDTSAINLPREGGRPHMMFAILDEGTRLILGAAIAPEGDVVQGYRRAAVDAQERIARIGSRLPWALRTARMEITAGLDAQASIGLMGRFREGGVRANVQLAQVPRRFGRYFRAIVGQRIGRVEITPGRTEDGTAIADNGDMTPWTLDEAGEALRQAVEQHDEAVLADLPVEEGRRVPDDLLRALEILATA